MISSSYFCAVRSAGVCEGTLWRQLETTSSSTSAATLVAASSLSLLSTEKTVDYCRLTGCCLECYESRMAWLRGDAPVCILHVVGASATATAAAATLSSTSTSTSSTHHDVTAFKLVTDQGTHFSCQATSGKCREIWLAAFGAGLELLFSSSSSSTSSTNKNKNNDNSASSSQDDDNDDDDDITTQGRLLPPAPQIATVKQRLMARLSAASKKYCISCGAVEGSVASTFPTTTTTTRSSSSSSSSGHNTRKLHTSPAAGNSSALKSHTNNVVTTTTTTTTTASPTATAAPRHYNNKIPPKLIAQAVAPLPQYGMEARMDLCQDCAVAQGLVTHTEFVQTCLAARRYELAALTQARQTCWSIVLAAVSSSSQQQQQQQQEEEQEQQQQQQQQEEEPLAEITTAAAAAAEGEEPDQQQEKQQQEQELPVASTTKMVEENPHGDDADPEQTRTKTTEETAIQTETESPDNNMDSSSPDHSSGDSSWSHVDSSDNTGGRNNANATAASSTTSPTGSWQAVDATHIVVPAIRQQQQQQQQPPPPSSQAWIHLPPTASSTQELMRYLRDPVVFGSLAKVSPVLQSLAHELLSGCIDVPDFLEQLDEAAGKQRQGAGAADLAELKKQAFRVAGDMGSAMKLLSGSALPVRESRRNTEVLVCILDFLLDLCQEGELSSVAFFWPQLCHIHLSMLPPENAAQVARIELMEDFLLTVATRYSVHLALQLVWSHTADLEESLYSQTCSVACRRRRFAVLKFVCELESILFDFDGCWGGGSVSLGRMLSPTGHQVEILGSRMKKIQALRKKQPTRLVRSARLERLSISQLDKPPEVAALEKLQIAKNADYFSCHLNFSRRLADIAEKLRFMDVDERPAALEEELTLLNASGAMGGDPLNNVRESLLRVVRVPSTEGHVFRSKERTPVLLLMELVDEEAEVPIIETPDKGKLRNDGKDEPLVEIIESQPVSKVLEDEEQIESDEERRPPTPPPCIEILEGANDDLIPSPKGKSTVRYPGEPSSNAHFLCLLCP